MFELIVGFYGLIWWLVFRKFKLLPINLWTVVSSVFIAGATFVFLLLILRMYQPITSVASSYALTVPIISEVGGRVIEVPVVANTPLKKGDVLFKIDPTPYQARIDAVSAELNLAQIELKRQTELRDRGAGGQVEFDRAKANVDRLTAEHTDAQYKLDATTVRAPADGFVTQNMLQPGQVVVPMPFSQQMVFVPDRQTELVAGFSQTTSQHIDPDDRAEVAFDSIPGRVFHARVNRRLPILAEGQVAASGQLRAMTEISGARVPVIIEMTDDMTGYRLPPGASATVTVYTGKLHHLDILRKVIIRIKSWENWIF